MGRWGKSAGHGPVIPESLHAKREAASPGGPSHGPGQEYEMYKRWVGSEHLNPSDLSHAPVARELRCKSNPECLSRSRSSVLPPNPAVLSPTKAVLPPTTAVLSPTKTALSPTKAVLPSTPAVLPPTPADQAGLPASTQMPGALCPQVPEVQAEISLEWTTRGEPLEHDIPFGSPPSSVKL
ncbi:hypothetical protein TREES_T100021915 [Tupaia chinensis]|uniref:Uncharacterized protein n=1 Tax=Tupaia chinensis TaxID=246437 RepID=L9JAN7_TUPCH|nr:hypothetical protein TREES_T100021915 [Tupaia chinensis]